MKYLCLIYDDEKPWQKFPKDVQDKYMSEYMAFSDSIKKSGQFVGANIEEAMHSYASALELATQEPERRFLTRRLAELRSTSPR